jgi:hypothetical protein
MPVEHGFLEEQDNQNEDDACVDRADSLVRKVMTIRLACPSWGE